MNISDILSVIALLVALASLAHTLHQARVARWLATEEKLTTLRVLAHQLVSRLNGAQSDIEALAAPLEKDVAYREFWETSTGEENSVATIHNLADTARDKASSIQAIIDRIESLSTKAHSRGIALRHATSPTEVEEMIGVFRVQHVAAEQVMRSIGRLQSRTETIEDRYRTRQPPEARAAPSDTA